MIVQLAKADDILDDLEIGFFIRVAKKLNVLKADYENVFKGNFEFAPHQYESKRIVLFHNLLLLIYVDGEIDDAEIHFCHDLGLKLGLNAMAIQGILTKLKEQPQIAIDPYRVNRVFKKYYN